MMKRIVVVSLAVMLTLGVMSTVHAANDIPIGGIFDVTGATGDVGKEYAMAIKDYIRYVNENGGINDRQVKLYDVDYQYKIPQAIAAYKKMKARKKIIAVMGWGTGDTEAMAPMMTKDKIPYLSASYSEHLTDANKFPYNFITATSYSDQAGVAMEFIKKNWKGKDPAKVCFVFSDTGFGRSPVADGKVWAKKTGLTVVNDQIVGLRALDATSQLLNMKKDGADFLFMQSSTMSSATVTKDVKKLGIDTKIILANWAINENWLDLVKDAGEGVYSTIPFAVWDDTDIKGVQLMHELRAKYHPNLKEKGTCNYTQGFISAILLCEALKKAGDDLSGPGIKKALETFRDFDPMGLSSPVTYTSESHKPCRSLKIYQVNGGKLTPISDLITLDDKG